MAQHGAMSSEPFDREAFSKLLSQRRISTTRFAKMVGISQNAMRLIRFGPNNPTDDTRKKIEDAISHVRFCTKCKRAFLEDDDDDDSKGTPTKTEATR